MRSNRPYVQIDPSVIEQARQMDLLSYLQRYEPSTLKRVAGNVYCTKEHDSLKISNCKWYWWSRGFGGYSALDYLIKVEEYDFVEAVEILTGQTMADWKPPPAPKKDKPKVLLLPPKNKDCNRVIQYLFGRGIDYQFTWTFPCLLRKSMPSFTFLLMDSDSCCARDAMMVIISAKELAKYFSVNTCSIYRLLKRLNETGSYETQTNLRGKKPKLSDTDHQHILSLLEKQPDISCLEIIETLNSPVSIDTVWRFLQKAGYRRKKKSLHASEQERPRCGREEEKLERLYIWIQGK